MRGQESQLKTIQMTSGMPIRLKRNKAQPGRESARGAHSIAGLVPALFSDRQLPGPDGATVLRLRIARAGHSR